jgi:membrane protease YdiL (CAAX protease family)
VDALVPWLRIGAAVLVYLLAAVGAMAAVRRTGVDLRDVAARTSPTVLAIGAVGNLVALAGVLLLLVLVDGRPISDLGLAMTLVDAAVLVVLIVANFSLGRWFVRVRGGGSRAASGEDAGRGTVGGPSRTPSAVPQLLGLTVLALVALQEEVLYRGYVTLNLAGLGWVLVVVASTAIFVAIHFLTNRASLLQVASWTASGVLLVLAYLLSGSIWVPVILHFAIDVSNVVVFDIAGRSSPQGGGLRLRDGERAAFRVAYAVAAAAVLLAVYGTAALG